MVGQDKVDVVKGEKIESLLTRTGSQDHVALKFEHELADGQLILFVVDT
jgi:hypothetical protein